MGQDAVAVLRLNADDLPKKWRSRVELRGDFVLLDTARPWRTLTADQHAFLLREDLGGTFAEHDDRRGVLFFSDAYEPAAYEYAKLVRELKGSDWGSVARCEREATKTLAEEGIDDAWFREHTGRLPRELGPLLSDVARGLTSTFGGDADAWRSIVEAVFRVRLARDASPAKQDRATKGIARAKTAVRATKSAPLYLEAVLDVTRDTVIDAVRRELARSGWTLGNPRRGDDARTIRLISSASGVALDDDRDATRDAFDGFRLSSEGRWVQMRDADDPDTQLWSKRLSSTLDTIGISMRANPEFGEVEVLRFDAGRERGAFRLRSGRPRGEVAKFEFVADLADDPKARAVLRKGLPIDHAQVTSTLVQVASWIGAPLPLASDSSRDYPIALTLRRPSLARFRAPKPTKLCVRFSEALHIPGISVHDLMALVAKALSEKGRVPARDNEVVRRAFFHVNGPWVSFGELAASDMLGIRWSKVLARVLRVPVLVVRTQEERVELELWSGAGEPTRRTVPDDVVRCGRTARFDLGWLAPVSIEGIEVTPASIPTLALKHGPRAMLAELGRRLNLPAPVLEGELEGYLLEFTASPTRGAGRREQKPSSRASSVSRRSARSK